MRILIADDDPLSADLLKAHCAKLDPTGATVHVNDGAEAMAQLRAGHWDLLLLDLNMPKVDGPTLLEGIGERVPVIIVTGDPAFALEAYKFHVRDYLVKPVTFERFASAWRALERTAPAAPATAGNSVFVRSGNDIVQVDLDEVRYVKSESNYVRYVLDGKEVVSLMNMKDLDMKLPKSFVRVHRSFIVNLRHIEKLDTSDIKVGRELIPVSETYRPQLLKQLELL
ncbi:MAG: response regulator transcription factor [Flavobacteriales bacterium]|nr:MAG: response regulator transcription factor [Flavobacteriales bacterium]